MNMKKFILFDLGGIFVPDSTKLLNREIAEYVGISEDEMAERWTAALPELFTGRIKIIDFYESRFGNGYDSKVLLQKHLDIYTRGFQINPAMVGLLQELNVNHTTACLSNTEIEVSEVNAKLGLYENFNIPVPFHGNAYDETGQGYFHIGHSAAWCITRKCNIHG